MERCKYVRSILGRQRERFLHDRLPALQALCADLLQDLDVHEVVAHFHICTVPADEVQLVALLDSAGGQLSKPALRDPEVGAERTPLPSWNDLGHLRTPRRWQRRALRRGLTLLLGYL